LVALWATNEPSLYLHHNGSLPVFAVLSGFDGEGWGGVLLTPL
jgi:hypothetical protein